MFEFCYFSFFIFYCLNFEVIGKSVDSFCIYIIQIYGFFEGFRIVFIICVDFGNIVNYFFKWNILIVIVYFYLIFFDVDVYIFFEVYDVFVDGVIQYFF